MNKFVKNFLQRGLVFGGLGPIMLGIIYAILEKVIPGFTLGGYQVLVAIVSIYLLAFIQAGASVFYNIEGWQMAKSLLCHFGILYVAYLLCYVVNSWIPFSFDVIMIFTGCFAVGYFLVWGIVCLTVKNTVARLNSKIN
jgi:hypothetical protein